MKIYLDPGHGGADPGAQGNGLNEKDITLDIALRLQAILVNNYQNVQVRMSRTTDTTVSLGQRTNDANAWGADFFLSIHINSAGSTARGYEDYIYNGLSDSSQTARIQQIIHEEVMKTNQLPDRGRRKANFHVLRETKMNAILTENGFISNAADAGLLNQPAWRQSVAQGHANGLARAFNLQPKANPAPAPNNPPAASSPQQPSTTGTLYKVISGSFKSRDNADERVAFLHSKGINSFVDTTVINGVTWYRVQTGAYANRANAENRLTELKNAGIQDAFIIADQGSVSAPASTPQPEAPAPAPAAPNPAPDAPTTPMPETPATPVPDSTVPEVPVSPSPDAGGSTPSNGLPVNTILGPTILSPMQMDQFVKQINPNAPELGIYYVTIGRYYGIRGDIAFAQALHETDFFRFTGTVQPGQNNFAGIGATGGSTQGAMFATPEEGVIAQMQHLYAYATTNPLPNQYPLLDPRFHLVARGSAPTWTDLNGKWAVPGTTYGQSILNLYGRMLDSAIGNIQAVRNSITS